MTAVDARTAHAATGLLADFNAGGVLAAADVQVARRLGTLGGEADERVLLAAALAVRGARLGSVAVDLTTAHSTAAGEGELAADPASLPWPDPARWLVACTASPLVAAGTDAAAAPLRLVGSLLYLDRYWRQEQVVRRELGRRTDGVVPVGRADLRAVLDGVFAGREAPDHQRLAAAAAACGRITVVAGGPGTGKTTAVAQLLAVLQGLSAAPLRVALAAPTGKAAARLGAAVAAQSALLAGRGLPSVGPLRAGTLHRLLGWQPGGGSRFRHDPDNHLPHDVVVVDETSMVSLTLMSRLVEAVRPQARLVLVGDPDQLASVEAGAVLDDLVRREPRPSPDLRAAVLAEVVPADLSPAEVVGELGNDVVRLRRNHRSVRDIADAAAAVRADEPDEVLRLLRTSPALELVDTPLGSGPGAVAEAVRADVVAAGLAVAQAAEAGDGTAALEAMDRHRVLCAHRRGPYGVARWAAEVERWLDAALPGHRAAGEWYPGRPLLVEVNDPDAELYNGDTGVVVAHADGVRVAFGTPAAPRLVAVGRLPEVSTVHAMTVHRGQGSEFERVTVVLPPPGSPLLTREMLYTALTRAKTHVRVLATEAAVVQAVHTPVVRASGLRRR